jgi:hypothetical protein
MGMVSSRMRTVPCRASALPALLSCLTWAGSAWAAPPPAGSGNPVAAVWKERHLVFAYSGRTARYSCEGLRDKVRAMLLDLGVRRDLSIVAIGCDDNVRAWADATGPRLRITFSALAFPDPAAKPAHVGDLAATDARFEAFTIASDAFRNMGIGDCELVDEFTRQILPTLATREVSQDVTCVPNLPSGNHFLVKGDVLRSLPTAEQGRVRQQ